MNSSIKAVVSCTCYLININTRYIVEAIWRLLSNAPVTFVQVIGLPRNALVEWAVVASDCKDGDDNSIVTVAGNSIRVICGSIMSVSYGLSKKIPNWTSIQSDLDQWKGDADDDIRSSISIRCFHNTSIPSSYMQSLFTLQKLENVVACVPVKRIEGYASIEILRYAPSSVIQ